MEMQRVVYVWERGKEKSWNIDSNETNNNLIILNKKCNKKLFWNIEQKEIKNHF